MSANVKSFHYDSGQRAFHWIMAALIFAAIPIGVYASLMSNDDPARGLVFMIHKSLGMTVLVLLPFRLIYRLIVGEPAYRIPLDIATYLVATAVHIGLYLAMIVMVVSGYVMSAAGGHDLPWFGLFTWPNVMAVNKPLAHTANVTHFWAAWALGALLVLHISGVVWHVCRGDEVLSRMVSRAKV